MQEFAFDTGRLIDVCRKNAVTSLGVFGSMARGEATRRAISTCLWNLENARACSTWCGWNESFPRRLVARLICLPKTPSVPTCGNAYWAKFGDL